VIRDRSEVADIPTTAQESPDNFFDKRGAASVESEGAGHTERFAGGDIGGDLVIGNIGAKKYFCRGHFRKGPPMGAPGVINHAQARMQDPAAPTHRLPALGRNIRGVGFSKEFAIELKDRIAANDKTVYRQGARALSALRSARCCAIDTAVGDVISATTASSSTSGLSTSAERPISAMICARAGDVDAR
jgi:hypothetical protein